MPAVPTLVYFPITGRAEIARLCFTLGGVEYQEKTVTPSEWPSYKPSTPFGGLPLLEIGDKIVSQSAGIDHYAAKLGGFLPGDPVAALLSDEAYYFVTQDIHATLLSPTRKLGEDAGVKAREQLAVGPLKERLAQLDKLVARRSGKFVAGDKLSVGDFAILNLLGMFKSGFWSGIPTDVFDHFTALKAYRNLVASEPGVRDFYAQKTDDVRVQGYRPDAA